MLAIMAHWAGAGTEKGIAMQGDMLIVGLAAPVRDAAYNSAALLGLDLYDQPAINIIMSALQCRGSEMIAQLDPHSIPLA
ncbi:hypothetical protein [Novosphingobium sp. ERW19]|uniref:hypothetical protein n=1 Tax=Novosphingobium sp. ERW19 TaxID=2726186 RepID=UPI00179CA89C|nr:hypothetical protein [Novosphingobium sp. ERW19]NLR40657.1 hypothetical protein [Novosphingobium sp. ERW19]